MQKPQAETPFANTDLNDEVMEEAQERLAQAMGSLTMAFAELGMARGSCGDVPAGSVEGRGRVSRRLQ